MTLLDRIRSMMARAWLNKEFWVEALNIESYLINRSPSTLIELKIPMEMWIVQVLVILRVLVMQLICTLSKIS